MALAVVPSAPIVSSYAGGSAVRGYVKDGRYFVDPAHGRPIVEVSEPTWRAVYWVERVWPFSAWVPGLAGLFLTSYGRGRRPARTPPPPKELPPWMLWACLAGAVLIVTGTGLFWVAVRVPWATMLVGWVLICFSAGAVAWLYARSGRPPPAAGPGAAPGPVPRQRFRDFVAHRRAGPVSPDVRRRNSGS